MLQNRVDPFGNIIKTAARGAWTGTRGVIHNDQQEIIRPFKLTAWITCRLEFKGRKRTMMSPNRYTELFFLDEATAFAGGHRPCAECRREDFKRFKSSWLKGNAAHGFNEKTSIKEIDNILHQERTNLTKPAIAVAETPAGFPDGVFVAVDRKAYLVFNQQLFLWSPFGYEKGMPLSTFEIVKVITPASVINAFYAGYRPQVNEEITYIE